MPSRGDAPSCLRIASTLEIRRAPVQEPPARPSSSWAGMLGHRNMASPCGLSRPRDADRRRGWLAHLVVDACRLPLHPVVGRSGAASREGGRSMTMDKVRDARRPCGDLASWAGRAAS